VSRTAGYIWKSNRDLHSGNAAYNVSKAGIKILTENLAYELRSSDSKLTAHLFVYVISIVISLSTVITYLSPQTISPGWTWTGIGSSFDSNKPKPEGAWTSEETVQYLFEKLKLGSFYIICPDNETSSELDMLRMRWGAEDLTEGRPALSRWHPEYKPVFEEYISQNLKRE
jgi:NAD(P)-dependent dehydrogenase (short-subunit alcohol dehydrogenase family)